MKDKFKQLEAAIIKECGNKPIYYLPNPGNWGDGLIRYGTLKFLNEININFKELTRNKKDWVIPLLRGGTVLYGGGGAWCKLWDHSNDVIRLKKRFKVIVLPSTYELTYSIQDVSFFRRDEYESKENMPNTNFCHDMAFYIGNEFVKKGHGQGEGYFFRYDEESAQKIKIPNNNNDLSMKGDHLSDVSLFFEEINKFSTVHTDRLHISIAASLLGKEVHLYQGAYFKNQAVYKSSLKDNFKNVTFHEEFEI